MLGALLSQKSDNFPTFKVSYFKFETNTISKYRELLLEMVACTRNSVTTLRFHSTMNTTLFPKRMLILNNVTSFNLVNINQPLTNVAKSLQVNVTGMS